MSDSISQEELSVVCYICQEQTTIESTMEVPITTGGVVRSHPACLDRYLKSATATPAACNSCSGDKGCC